MFSPPSAWILAEPFAGMASQGRGLAERAGLAAEFRPLVVPPPWRWLTARLWPAPLERVNGALHPPWPEIAIGVGGAGGVITAALRAERRIAAVQIQHPRLDPRRFDLVFVSPHDGLKGANVVVTRTALHGVTPARLAAAAEIWAPRLAALPRPRLAVLVGGANGRFRLGRGEAEGLAQALVGLITHEGAGVMLTPSRRTAPEVRRLLTRTLRPRGAYVWDGEGDNPYLGLLALADAILVTEDSVSMISEAVATPHPVLLYRLPGHSRRQRAFSAGLIAAGRVREFKGRLEIWPVEPIDDSDYAAAELRRRLRV
jgi:mitochondrial fission protein ELM1